MKRLTLLTVLLVVVGLTAGFALEVAPTISISGSATLSWGVDLDNSTTGFNNTFTSDMVVTLVAADSSDTHKGEGAAYGEITISDIDLSTTAGAWVFGANAVAAKIVAAPLEIGVYAAPSLAQDKVAVIEATADDVVDAETTTVAVGYGLYGTWIKGAFDPITATFKIVSEDMYGLNVNNAYAFGFDGSLAVAPLTIDFGVAMGMGYAANPLGFSAKVSAAIAPIDVWVAYDGSSGATFDSEVGAGATVTLAPDTTFVLSLYYDLVGVNDLDVKAVFTEPAAGLIPDMDLTLTVYVLDVLSAMEYEVIVDGGYTMGVLYPNFTITYGNPSETTVDVFKVMVGVDAKLIPLTTFGLYYTSGNLMAATPVMGTVVASATVTY